MHVCTGLRVMFLSTFSVQVPLVPNTLLAMLILVSNLLNVTGTQLCSKSLLLALPWPQAMPAVT